MIKKIFIFLLFFPFVIYSNDWVAGSGSWNTPANWNPAAVPNAPDDVAIFPSGLGPISVTMDISPTIGTFDIQVDAQTTFSPLPSRSILFTGTSPLFIDNTGLANQYLCDFNLLDPTTFSTTSTMTIPSKISGSGGLIKAGTGTLILSGDNSLGSILISEGTLQVGNAFTLNTSTVITNNGTFDLNNFSQEIGSLAGNGVITLGSGTLTLLNNLNTNFSGVISGIGGLIKTGISTITLSGNNLYLGSTQIQGGTLRTGAVNALPSSTAVTVNTVFDLNNFNQSIGSLAGNTSGSVNLGSATLTTGNNNNSTNFSGIISGSGGLTKEGAGTFTLSGANTYLGATLISSGTLRTGNANALSASTAVTDNSVFDLNNSNQSIGSLAGNGSVILGLSSATILTTGNDNTNTTFSGIISGNGRLTKVGTGTFTLSGANTYSGATLISAGTIQAGAVNTLFSSTAVTDNANFDLNNFDQSIGSLAGNGSVILGSAILTTGNNGTSTNFSGIISGNGGLIKLGAGTFTLSGANNTYSGATLISTGTIQAGVANALPSSTAVIDNSVFDLNNFNQSIGSLAGNGSGLVSLGSATLTTGNNGTSTNFAGSIFGAGGLTKLGTGILTLSGANTYLGSTLISNGTLETGVANALSSSTAVTDNSIFNLNSFNQSIGSLAGSGTVTLGSAALTTGNDNSSTIFSGGISGSGSLIKEGTGKFTLSGNNTYGDTDVNNGDLAVLGTIISGNITVASPALLTGNGVIIGNITNNGGIRPGASIGTLSVVGDVTFNNGSVYQVEFDPTASDLLDVVGNVIINADTSVELIPDFTMGSYAPSQTFTIIQSTGLVSGTFDNIITNFPAFIGNLVYGSNFVNLVVNVSSFSQLVSGGNPGSVASYFDTLSPADGSDLQFVIESLQFLSIEEMTEAFDQLHPSIFKGLSLVSESNAVTVRSLINQRISQLYNPKCLGKYSKCREISIWASPFYENYSQKNIHDLIGFNSNSGGFAIGFDKELVKNNYLGIFSGYSLSDIKWKRSRGQSDINSFYAGLYYSWFNEKGFINTSLIGSFNNFKGSRNIEFPSISRIAKNNHNGKDVTIHLDGGLIFTHCDTFNILPFASLDYFYMRQDGFTETNANSLNLDVKKSDYHLFRSEIGSHFNKCFFCEKDFIADLKLSYVQETRFHGRHYSANLVNQSGNFVVSGIKYNRNIFSPGLTISKMFSRNNIILSMKYDGEFGKKYINNNISAQLVKSF